MIHNYIKTLDKEKILNIYRNKYIEYILEINTDYWDSHKVIFNKLTLDNKDIKILDVGTWFGFIPAMLNYHGFKHVTCTDCNDQTGPEINELKNLWNFLNISPFELKINPLEKFTLPETYDLILLTKSNVYWKCDDVVCFHENELHTQWQVIGKDNKPWTFFVVWNSNEWEFFIDNLKEYLNPNGIAVIQPSPFVYNWKPEKYKKELTVINKHKFVELGLDSYFIVENA